MKVTARKPGESKPVVVDDVDPDDLEDFIESMEVMGLVCEVEDDDPEGPVSIKMPKHTPNMGSMKMGSLKQSWLKGSMRMPKLSFGSRE